MVWQKKENIIVLLITWKTLIKNQSNEDSKSTFFPMSEGD